MNKDRTLLRDFWNCGDSQTIEFAVSKARLNRHELEVIELLLDGCWTQEQAAEKLDISPRALQKRWYTAADKLLQIPWLETYARELRRTRVPDVER